MKSVFIHLLHIHEVAPITAKNKCTNMKKHDNGGHRSEGNQGCFERIHLEQPQDANSRGRVILI